MYSIFDYGDMIVDRVRMEAYTQAVRQAVKPGAIVIDLGAGSGLFTLLACKFGAARVYAIEYNNAIQVAREMAAANGYADRITFIQELSTRVSLPERADVIISDLRGVLPLLEQHIPSLLDARERLLAPGGVLIPQRDTLWAALLSAPAHYERHFRPWQDDLFGLNTQACSRLLANAWRRVDITAEELLVEPQCWATLDYRTVREPNLTGELNWKIASPGTAHGLGLWFDATLADGVQFSNAPGNPKMIYGRAYFPWPQPVELAAGDEVVVRVQANLVDNDYIWSWNTRVFAAENSAKSKIDFQQSTFFSAPLSPQHLRKRADNFVPSLNDDGQITQVVLHKMSEKQALGDIARDLTQQFPQHFPTWPAALTRVGELSLLYSE
ncbi:50S ribosomal protein L11 methyltransferase [candidate division KSB1 bacterium]|nr:50S ribosomal protein L11 methyltransferase [candidate division KSB1 bacterium]